MCGLSRMWLHTVDFFLKGAEIPVIIKISQKGCKGKLREIHSISYGLSCFSNSTLFTLPTQQFRGRFSE